MRRWSGQGTTTRSFGRDWSTETGVWTWRPASRDPARTASQRRGSPIRASELSRYAHVVLFAPEDLQIVRGEPAARRRFSDDLISQRSPRMSAVLVDYDRVLRQRNALLKSSRGLGEGGLRTLEVWDEKLVALGSQIIDARAALADELQPIVARAYSAIAGADHGPALTWTRTVDGADPEEGQSDAVAHASGESTPAAFRRALESRRRAEPRAAVTFWSGPTSKTN